MKALVVKRSYIINRQRIPETREGNTEGTIREFKFGGEFWNGDKQVVKDASCTSRCDIGKITKRWWFRFMEEIVSNMKLYSPLGQNLHRKSNDK